MKKLILYDAKPYDKIYFDKQKVNYDITIDYIDTKLNEQTAILANGYDAVCAFVNDDINAKTIDILNNLNIHILAMRCAGYNNVDIRHAFGKLHITRVPAYSPYAIAEHAMALLLSLNRKIHKAYSRIKEHNFSLNGLTGFDLYGKTVGVIGTGRIGQVFINICKGFGCNVIAYDLYPNKSFDINYVTLDELLKTSDIISLHCPLTKETKHMINNETISLMKNNVIIVNTSRGALINSSDLLESIKNKKIAGACLDVYEEEEHFFYEDLSQTIINDEILTQLIAKPNVLVTSHQAFLTDEALESISTTTLSNVKTFFSNEVLENEICYRCSKFGTDKCTNRGRCF